MASGPLEAFQSSLKEYFNQDALFDLVVTCEGTVFKAHRLILCAHSEYFVKQLNGPWKESSDQVIKVEDFNLCVVEAMLHFMYQFDYTNTTSTSPMVFEAQVYQIADKYDVESLKKHAAENFGAAIESGWSTDEFPLAITVAYTTAPDNDRGLRDPIVKTSDEKITALLDRRCFVEGLRNTPGFAADLSQHFCYKIDPDVKQYLCSSCNSDFSCSMCNSFWYCPVCGMLQSI